jgi:hypothetical protein
MGPTESAGVESAISHKVTVPGIRQGVQLGDGIVYPEVLELLRRNQQAYIQDSIGERRISDTAELVDQYDQNGYDYVCLTYLLKPFQGEHPKGFVLRAAELVRSRRAEVDHYNEQYGDDMQVKLGVAIDTSFQNRYRGICPWGVINEVADVVLLRHVHSKEKIAESVGAVSEMLRQVQVVKNLGRTIGQAEHPEAQAADFVAKLAQQAAQQAQALPAEAYLALMQKPVWSYLDAVELRKHLPDVELLVEHGETTRMEGGNVYKTPDGLDDALRGMAETKYLDLRGRESMVLVAMAQLKAELTGCSLEEALQEPVLNQVLYNGVEPERLARTYRDNGISIVLPFVHVKKPESAYEVAADNRVTDFFLGALEYSGALREHGVRLVPCSKYPAKGEGISNQVYDRLCTLERHGNNVAAWG